MGFELSATSYLTNSNLKLQEYYDLIWELDHDSYKEKPVDIDTFLEDEKYVGKIFGGSAVFKYWRDLLRDVYPSPFYTKYNEVIMSCAIGVGKSTLTTISMLYEFYKLLCLKNPAKYYGLMITDTIVLAIFSSSKDNVGDVNWKKIKDAIAISPWFQDMLKLDKVEPKVKSLDIAPNIAFQLGSRYQNAIGRDILIAVIDEGNNSIINDQTKINYNEISRRRESRFIDGFNVPGVLWLVSSPKTKDDFLNERIEKSKNDPKVLIIDELPAWIVKAEKNNYCGKTFNVFVGDESRDARILDDSEDVSTYPKHLIMQPPIEHYESFKEDLLECIRDIGGKRVSSILSLFKSVETLNKVLSNQNLFLKDVQVLDIYNKYTDIVLNVKQPILKQMLDVKYDRYLHIDFGSTGDMFGLASCYSKYNEVITNPYGSTAMSRINSIDKERLYIIEWAIGFKAANNNGIPTNAILNFLLYLKKLGYPIKKISSDTPGLAFLKELIAVGFETEYISVDTSRIPYITLKNKVHDGTVFGPQSPKLSQELLNLRDDLTKIDHSCLDENTNILIYNKGPKSIKDLANKGKDYKFNVYAKDSNNNTVIAEAFNAHKTKVIDKYIEIILENNTIIKCTLDHLFMLKDGTYKEAQYLTEEDDLMEI